MVSLSSRLRLFAESRKRLESEREIGVLHESEQWLQKKRANGVRVRHVSEDLANYAERTLDKNAGRGAGYGDS